MKSQNDKVTIYGVGINDADYAVNIRMGDGLIKRCHYYDTWKSMLRRCYCTYFKCRHTTYENCKVCDEWLVFSNFKRWMETQDWQGKQLDKDLLIKGNKTYSPETCIFVHQVVNKFVTDRSRKRGDYMLGVHWDKSRSKFKAQCSNPFTGKNEYLGRFDSEIEAHLAWKARKHELAVMLANSLYCSDKRLKDVLTSLYR